MKYNQQLITSVNGSILHHHKTDSLAPSVESPDQQRGERQQVVGAVLRSMGGDVNAAADRAGGLLFLILFIQASRVLHVLPAIRMVLYKI